tara:strand:+ start:390 stop:1004 length:615 start_codon:yes stop_codon:yes gene_type:complete
MNILFLTAEVNENLSSYEKVIYDYNPSDKIIKCSNLIDYKFIEDSKIDIILKDRYKHDLSSSNINLKKIPYINFHPSFLPFNMKNDSNLWSIINNTPKGSSIIRMMDFSWNDFDLIGRTEAKFDNKDTLKTSFNKCIKLFEKLFEKYWPLIRESKYEKIEFTKDNNEFRDGSEKGDFMNFLDEGYNTPISKIQNQWLIYKKIKF